MIDVADTSPPEAWPTTFSIEGAGEYASVNGVTLAEAEERIAAMVGDIDWANLTDPALRQMTRSLHVWRSLANIAIVKWRTKNKGQGAEWGPRCPAGQVQLRINPKGGLRCAIRLRSGHQTIGPNEVSGRNVDISNVKLPETLLMSLRGKRLDQILESNAFLAIVPGDTVIRSARAMSWGTRLTLDLPFIQPTPADLAMIRAANDPGASQ